MEKKGYKQGQKLDYSKFEARNIRNGLGGKRVNIPLEFLLRK